MRVRGQPAVLPPGVPPALAAIGAGGAARPLARVSLGQTQPTHPAFYEHDERQFTCNVCNSKFSVAPPSRHELMKGFTGEELAGLLVSPPPARLSWAQDVGCLIVSEKRNSAQMEEVLRHNSHIRQAPAGRPSA